MGVKIGVVVRAAVRSLLWLSMVGLANLIRRFADVCEVKDLYRYRRVLNILLST